MARYDNRDVSFEVPEGWEDASVISFRVPGSPAGKLDANVTLMRSDTRPMSTPLATYAMQQVTTLASALPKFELVSQRDVMFGGLHAVEVLYSWSTPDGGVTQRITLFDRGAHTWTFTATARRAEFEGAKPHFDRIASTLQFAQGGSPSSPSSPSTPSSGGGLPPLTNPFEPPRRR